MGTGISMSSVNKIKELVESRDYSLALDILEHQDLTKSLSPQFIRICGEVYHENGRYAEARAAYVKAHSMAPMGNKIIYSLIRLYLAMGFFTLAEQYYEIYLFNQEEKDAGTYRIEYLLAKAYHKPVNELYSIIISANEMSNDDIWDYEMLLIYAAMHNEERLKDEAEMFKATYKTSPYLVKVENLLDGRLDIEKEVYCFPKEEQEDNDPAQEETRVMENHALSEDDLRMHPKDAKIVLMVEDREPIPNSVKFKQMFVKSKEKRENRKEESGEKTGGLFSRRMSKKDEEAFEEVVSNVENEAMDKETLLDEVLRHEEDESTDTVAEVDEEPVSKTDEEIIEDDIEASVSVDFDQFTEETFNSDVEDFDDIEDVNNIEQFENIKQPDDIEEDAYTEEQEISWQTDIPEQEETVYTEEQENFMSDTDDENLAEMPETAEESEPAEGLNESKEAYIGEAAVNQIDISVDLLDSYFYDEVSDDEILEETTEDETAFEEAEEAPSETLIEPESFDTDVVDAEENTETEVFEEAASETETFDTEAFEAETFETETFDTEAFEAEAFEAEAFSTETFEEDSFGESSLSEDLFGDVPYENAATEETATEEKAFTEDTPEEESFEAEVFTEDTPEEESFEAEVSTEDMPEEESFEKKAVEAAGLGTSTLRPLKGDFPVFRTSLFPDYNNEPEEIAEPVRRAVKDIVVDEKAQMNLKKEEQLINEADELLARLGIELGTKYSSNTDYFNLRNDVQEDSGDDKKKAENDLQNNRHDSGTNDALSKAAGIKDDNGNEPQDITNDKTAKDGDYEKNSPFKLRKK